MMLLIFLLLLVFPAAQAQNAYPFLSPAPPSVVSGAGSVVGLGGSNTYYYWIVSRYVGGNALPYGPIAVTQAPSNAQRSPSRYIALSWTPNTQETPTGYDVLRTTTSSMPTGACGCVVSAAQVGLTLSDTGLSLGAYTVTTASTSTALLKLDSTTQTPPALVATINGVTGPVGGGGGGVAGLAVDADGTVKASVALTWATASTPTFNGGGTTTCNLALSNACTITATGATTTVALTNPHGTGLFGIRWFQDAVGGRVPTWPASIQGTCVVDATPLVYTDLLLRYDGTNYGIESCSSPLGLAGVSLGARSSDVCATGENGIYTIGGVLKGCNSGTKFTIPTTAGSGAICSRAVTGTTDTILASDNGCLIVYTNLSGTAVNLPAGGSAGFTAPFSFSVIPSRPFTGYTTAVTITPTTSTIDDPFLGSGQTSMSVFSNQPATIVLKVDNNYATLAGGSGIIYDAGSQVFFAAARTYNFQSAPIINSAYVKSGHLRGNGSAPTVTGCGTIGAGSTNMSGRIISSTTGACTPVLTFADGATATTEWRCPMDNSTTVGNKMTQTTSTTTTITWTGTTVSGDILRYGVCGS